MNAVKGVAEYCQATDEATVEGGVARIVILLTDTLECSKNLRVQHVPAIGAEVADAASHTDRPHDGLTAIGGKTRFVFAAAIAKRFLPRYSSAHLHHHTHLFDHAILLSPRSRKMKHIDLLLESTAAKSHGGLADALAIKTRIHDEVVALIAQAVAEMRARKAVPSEVADVMGPPSTTPQAVPAATHHSDRVRSTGIPDGSDSEAEGGASPQQLSPQDEAENILKEWLQQEVIVRVACAVGEGHTSYIFIGKPCCPLMGLDTTCTKSIKRMIQHAYILDPVKMKRKVFDEAVHQPFTRTICFALVLRDTTVKPFLLQNVCVAVLRSLRFVTFYAIHCRCCRCSYDTCPWASVRQIPTSKRCTGGADYWRTHGRLQPLPLRAVAQAVFGCPTSSGAMERDFSAGDMLVPCKRSSIDRAYFEMSFFLRAHYDQIPLDVPKLSDEEMMAAIPNRLKDEELLEEVRALDVDVKEFFFDYQDPFPW